jgi:hypothetical protein
VKNFNGNDNNGQTFEDTLNLSNSSGTHKPNSNSIFVCFRLFSFYTEY